MFTLEGAFDLHVHAAPDLVMRSGDDMQFALLGRDAGMAGIAVKAMLESTVSRAYYVNKAVSGFHMVGGVCLNYSVGGINPAAVDTTLRSGGRVVWMPTGHSKFHAIIKGELGNWGKADHRLYTPPRATGLSIFDDQGRLTCEIKDVVSLVKQHNALIGTSHLSPEEILELCKYCQKEKVKLVVNHLGWTPTYDLALGKAALEYGAYVELTAVTFGGYAHKMEIEDAAFWIREMGVNHLVLATDAGARRFASPPEMLRIFGENLILQGIPETDVRQMMGLNPLSLVEQ